MKWLMFVTYFKVLPQLLPGGVEKFMIYLSQDTEISGLDSNVGPSENETRCHVTVMADVLNSSF
jgi:hypothetical protein